MKVQTGNLQTKRKAQGQGLVEFALALPVFLLVIFAIIEFARLLLAYSAVYTASREAARYGAAVGISDSGVPYYEDCAGMRQAAVRVGIMGGVNDGNIDIRVYPDEDDAVDWNTLPQCPTATVLGNRIAVRVQGSYQPIVPLVNIPSMPIVSVASRTIVQGVDILGTPGPTMTPRPITGTPTVTRTHTLTFTPTATFTITPSRTPTQTFTPTVFTPTTTDSVEQTRAAQTQAASNMTSTAAVATANAYATQLAQTQTAQALQTQIAQNLTATSSSLTKTAAADCGFIVARKVGGPSSKYVFKLDNTSSASAPRNASITSITIRWAGSFSLDQITFDGAELLTNTYPGPAMVTISQFKAGEDLTLNRPASKTMTLSFNGDPPEVSLVQVQFNNQPCPAVSPY